MVMVEIDSNVILVEPLKSCKDAELTRYYHVLMMRLNKGRYFTKYKCAGRVRWGVYCVYLNLNLTFSKINYQQVNIW